MRKMTSQGSHWSERLQLLAVCGSSALQPVSKHNDLSCNGDRRRAVFAPPTLLANHLGSCLAKLPPLRFPGSKRRCGCLLKA